MNTIERANMVSFNALGGSQYLGLLRQRTQMQVSGQDNTDGPPAVAGAEEEEQLEVDDEVAPDGPTSSVWRPEPIPALMEVLRAELNNMMAAENFQDSAVLQALILQFLDELRDRNQSIPFYRRRCSEIFNQLSDQAGRRRDPCAAARCRGLAESFASNGASSSAAAE